MPRMAWSCAILGERTPHRITPLAYLILLAHSFVALTVCCAVQLLVPMLG